MDDDIGMNLLGDGGQGTLSPYYGCVEKKK